MKMKFAIAVCLIIIGFALPAFAQTYDTNNDVVGTFAGYGIPGYVDGQGQLTAFAAPAQIVSDTASNLYVWDSGNSRIRKITPDGTVSTFVGGGSYLEGFGTNVTLSWGNVGAMAIDHANAIWIVISGNYNYYNAAAYIVRIETNGFVSIVNGGLTNLSTASGICFDSANNLYYSGGNRIYRYTFGGSSLEAIAGSGIVGYFDGPGPLFSAFSNPTVLACDQADNIYVWDSGNYVIRKIGPDQNVSTYAGGASSYSNHSSPDGVGTNASFSGVTSLFCDHQGNLYVVQNTSVRKIDANTNVVTLAGVYSYSYSQTFADGPGNQARFYNPNAGCFSQGMVFVADTGNNRIREISFNAPLQVVPPANLQLNTYAGIQITGTIGRTYEIQESPDLQTWNTAATVLLNSSPYLWLDQRPASGKQYYRAVLMP